MTGSTTKFAYIIDDPQPTHIIGFSARLEFNETIYILADLMLPLNPKIYDSVNFTYPTPKNNYTLFKYLLILKDFLNKWAKIALSLSFTRE